MSTILQALRGMNDILPDEAERWEAYEFVLAAWAKSYGYRPLRTPLVEPTALFRRAIGEVTDIVEKEMYSFADQLNGDHVSLRPEGTASCVRAVLQHNLLYDGPKRLYYHGPMFRHERPQKGRYRQFHQFGVEALGWLGPDVDAEHILMCARLWEELGIEDLRLEINSLGSAEERAQHRHALLAYFESHAGQLDQDASRRLHSNPLRILDSKNPDMQALIRGAPMLIDHLGPDSKAHFDAVRGLLTEAGIQATVNSRLVRGLDYYNRTVFEWVSDRLGAQGTVCAGGRYDGLIAQLGGKPVPACGFAIGLERLMALVEDHPPAPTSTEVYVIHQGDEAATVAFAVADEMRRVGMSVILNCGGGSLKTQMRRADASGAVLAVIVGEDELRSGEVTLKPLRAQGEQWRTSRTDYIEQVAELLLGQNEDEQLEDENGRTGS